MKQGTQLQYRQVCYKFQINGMVNLADSAAGYRIIGCEFFTKDFLC